MDEGYKVAGGKRTMNELVLQPLAESWAIDVASPEMQKSGKAVELKYLEAIVGADWDKFMEGKLLRVNYALAGEAWGLYRDDKSEIVEPADQKVSAKWLRRRVKP